MAVSSIAVPPDPARDARARALVDQVATWPRHTLRVAWGSFEAGTTFRRATGSGGAHYLVNAVVCSCPDYQQAGYICKYVRAVVLFEQRQAKPAPTPSALDRLAELYPKCKGCDDLADSRDGYCDRCASDREWQARLAARQVS